MFGEVNFYFSAMTTFKTMKEWQAFVTGRKFVRSDNAAIYHFVNPLLNKGINLKVLWKGKETAMHAEFNAMGNAVMKVGDEVFTLKGVAMADMETSPALRDVIYTILEDKEVQFVRLS